MNSIKYQTLILIVVLLGSAYFLKERSVFSDAANGESSATIIKTVEVSNNTFSEQEKVVEALSLSSEEIGSQSAVLEKPFVEQNNEEAEPVCSGLTSEIYLAKNIDDGKVIMEKGSGNRWPIASITKLMTATVALENFNLSDEEKITKEILDQVGEFASFKEGEIYSVDALIKASLVFSSNDAAYALAKKMGLEEFINKMNKKAVEIGMVQTNFYEPSGLSYLNQSTADDLYTLMKYVYRQYPVILDISRQKEVSLKERASGKMKKFSNINLFAGRKDFFGGKTGFIDQSGGNLVTLFLKNGKIVMLSVLASDDRFGDIEKMLSCVK